MRAANPLAPRLAREADKRHDVVGDGEHGLVVFDAAGGPALADDALQGAVGVALVEVDAASAAGDPFFFDVVGGSGGEGVGGGCVADLGGVGG